MHGLSTTLSKHVNLYHAIPPDSEYRWPVSQTHHSVSTCWSLVDHCNSIGVQALFDTPFHWGTCWSVGHHSIGVSPGVWFVILLKYLWVLGLVFGKVHENEILSVYPLMFWQVIPSGYLLSFCSCRIRLWM